MGDRIIMIEVNPISKIEGLELLNSHAVNRKNLLVKLDGDTLRITQRSWFSMRPSPKKIFDEVIKIHDIDFATLDILRVVKLLNEQVKPTIYLSRTKKEGFVTKIIRFISEYFGWRLSKAQYEQLNKRYNRLNKQLALPIFRDIMQVYNNTSAQKYLIKSFLLKDEDVSFNILNQEEAEQFVKYMQTQKKIEFAEYTFSEIDAGRVLLNLHNTDIDKLLFTTDI